MGHIGRFDHRNDIHPRKAAKLASRNLLQRPFNSRPERGSAKDIAHPVLPFGMPD